MFVERMIEVAVSPELNVGNNTIFASEYSKANNQFRWYNRLYRIKLLINGKTKFLDVVFGATADLDDKVFTLQVSKGTLYNEELELENDNLSKDEIVEMIKSVEPYARIKYYNDAIPDDIFSFDAGDYKFKIL